MKGLQEMGNPKWDNYWDCASRPELPEISAVYGFFDGSQCLYIGQTKNIKQRMCGQDHRDRMRDSANPLVVRFVRTPPSRLKQIENEYIKVFSPTQNKIVNFESIRNKIIRMSISLEDDMYDQLEIEAKRQYRTLTSLIVFILSEWISNKEAK